MYWAYNTCGPAVWVFSWSHDVEEESQNLNKGVIEGFEYSRRYPIIPRYFILSLSSTSSTSATDVSLSRSGMNTLEAFGGSFWSPLLFVFNFWTWDSSSLGATPMSVHLSFSLRWLTCSLPEVSWVLVLKSKKDCVKIHLYYTHFLALIIGFLFFKISQVSIIWVL